MAVDLIAWLERRDLEVCLVDQSAAALGRETAPRLEPNCGCDLVIALGGDGTLLGIARIMTDVPVLGVNLGRLGFLTEIARPELYPTLMEVLAGRFETEARALLDVEIRRAEPDADTSGFRALNDAVIAKSALAGIIELTLRVGGRFVATYRSDGLIISTPTGSTAYNLSSGGPILNPQLPVIVLTPICPHAFSLRPVVVPDDSAIEVTLETLDEKVHLTLDGQESTTLRPGDTVRLTRSSACALLVKVSGRTFYDSLRGKLGWGE
jgi:NAD+ kinase